MIKQLSSGFRNTLFSDKLSLPRHLLMLQRPSRFYPSVKRSRPARGQVVEGMWLCHDTRCIHDGTMVQTDTLW